MFHLSHPPPHSLCYQWQRWITPQMFSFMGALSIQHSVTFIFTIGIQNLVSIISGPFRRESLSMTLWRTSWPETRSFPWSDSWLSRTLPAAKVSPWYPQGRSTSYFGLDPCRKFSIFFLLALWTCWRRQDGDPSGNCRVHMQSIQIGSEFWGQLFLF